MIDEHCIGDNVLTIEERELLSTAESAIERFRIAYWEAGAALNKIFLEKLYRENYVTFDAYCHRRWNMDRVYAHYLIKATLVREMRVNHG